VIVIGQPVLRVILAQPVLEQVFQRLHRLLEIVARGGAARRRRG
jgi:hypothetical protein